MTSHANRGLAQLVERHPYKVNVAGSTPVPPTKLLKLLLNKKSLNLKMVGTHKVALIKPTLGAFSDIFF